MIQNCYYIDCNKIFSTEDEKIINNSENNNIIEVIKNIKKEQIPKLLRKIQNIITKDIVEIKKIHEQIARIVDFLWTEQQQIKGNTNNAKFIRWLHEEYPNIFFLDEDVAEEYMTDNKKNNYIKVSHETFRKYFYVHKNYLVLIDDYEGYIYCSISWHNTFNHSLEIKSILDDMRNNGHMEIGQPFHFMLVNSNENIKKHQQVFMPMVEEDISLNQEQQNMFYLQCIFNTKECVNVSLEDFIYKKGKLYNIIEHCYYHGDSCNLWFKYDSERYVIKDWNMIHCEIVLFPNNDKQCEKTDNNIKRNTKYDFCLISKFLFYIKYVEKNNIGNNYNEDKENILTKEKNTIVMINNEKLMEYISSHSIFKNIFITGFYFPENNIVDETNLFSIQEFIQKHQQISCENFWKTIENYKN